MTPEEFLAKASVFSTPVHAEALAKVAEINAEGIEGGDHAVAIYHITEDRWSLILHSVLSVLKQSPAVRPKRNPLFSITTSQFEPPDDRYIAFLTNDWTKYAIANTEAEAIGLLIIDNSLGDENGVQLFFIAGMAEQVSKH